MVYKLNISVYSGRNPPKTANETLSCIKGVICNSSALKCLKTTRPMSYILFSCVLTLSQMFPTNSEKSVILITVTIRFIWSPVNGVIPPLPKSKHTPDAYGGAVFVHHDCV